MFKRTTLFLLLAFTLVACTAPATVIMKDGREFDGVIVDSTQNEVLLENGEAIDRAEIEEIDHPTAYFWLGGISLATSGLLFLAISDGGEHESNGGIDGEGMANSLLAMGGITLGTSGIAMLIMGAFEYGISTSAAAPPEEKLTPSVWLTPEAGGVGLTLRF